MRASRARRWTSIALAGGLLVAVGPVLAAVPAPNTRWNGHTNQPSGQLGFVVTAQQQAVLTLGAFRWRCRGRSALRFFQPSASAGPVSGLKIDKDGKFGGTARGVIVNDRRKRIGRGTVGWSGQFKTDRKASGTMRFHGAGCATPALRWSARLTRQR